MHILRPRFSLRWKLLLGSAVVLAVMLVALVVNNLRLIESSLEEQAELRVREMAVLLNASVAPSMAALDYGALQGVFTESLRDEGLLYFVLFDRNDAPVATYGWPAGQALPQSQSRLGHDRGAQRLDTRIPINIGQQRYGELQFGISTAFLHEARDRLVRQSALIATTGFVLTIALLWSLGFWLTRDLTRLEAASRAVANGNFAVSPNITSRDEIGQVAQAFDAMTSEIQRRLGELSESEARFRSLTELSADWYWEQDADLRFSAFLGMPEQLDELGAALLGRRLLDTDRLLIDQVSRIALVAQLEQREPFRDIECAHIDASGRASGEHYAVSGAPHFDRAGRFLGYRGVGKDVTQRKQAELRLRLAAGVFTHAREGIVIADDNGRVVDANDTFTHITGLGRDDILGKRVCDLDLDDGQPANQQIWDALRQDGHWSGETWHRRSNGEQYALMQTISAVRDAGGRTRQYVALLTDITAMKEYARQLEHIAHFDALTGLPNRILLTDRLQQAIVHCRRQEHMLAVAFLDLDGFKAINDQHGHNVGDDLLVAVAGRMSAALREGDTLSRIGGDEFVAILADLRQPQDCEALLQRLLHAAADPVVAGGWSLQVTASIGVTLFPQDDAEADTLIRHADQAMYLAKQAGKNRYHLFDVAQDMAAQTRRETLADIERALARGEFVLYYQPKVNLVSGEVIGAEALIRWQHPVRGLLPPAAFLPVIEGHALSISLGEWVIDTALTQMAHWQADRLYMPVSVNVGARQLEDADFPGQLAQLLERHPGVPPHCLQLEILETSALEDTTHIADLLHACKSLGVEFALDDFGTGYSSLTYLKRLPTEVLKIDQTFVRDMLVDANDLAIIKGIIGLAAAFERSVIAEGVETLAHGESLVRMGCPLAQGYGIARPMPAAQLPAWTRRWHGERLWLRFSPEDEALQATRH